MTVDKNVPNILVLGGGIVGLNTALRLQKDYPRAKITIMAENWLDKTVSQVAAGFFRATKGIRGPSEEVTQQWLRDAWSYYVNLKVTESSRDTGIIDVRFDFPFKNFNMNIRQTEFFEHPLGFYNVVQICTLIRLSQILF